MWPEFLLACLLSLAILYVPGSLALRGVANSSVLTAIIGAPLITMAFVPLLAIALSLLGVRASLWTLVLPIALVGLIACATRGYFGRSGARRDKGSSKKPLCAKDCLFPALYVLFGVIVVGFIFVKNLDGAYSFLQEYDNGNHLSTIRTFLESGDFSSFNLFPYDAEADGFVAPLQDATSFYPAGWHALVALLVDALGVPITLGVNAVNAVLLGVVFPLGFYALTRQIFGGERLVIMLGSIASMAFASSVIDFVAFGPLYPMLLAYALAPFSATCFMRLFDADSPLAERIRWAAIFVVGCAAIAFAQPSGIFLLAVLLAPYCVWQAYRLACLSGRGRAFSIACPVVTALLIVAIWLGCYSLPFFGDVVSFNWDKSTSLVQAVVDVLLLSMHGGSAQVVLSMFVFIGMVRAILDPKKRWIAAAWAIAALAYVLSVATEGELKHILGGFWYTDPHRLVANVAIMASPIAAMGMAVVYEALKGIFSTVSRSDIARGLPAALMAVAICAIFLPNHVLRGWGDVETAFGKLANDIEEQNSQQATHVLTKQEFEFAEKALSLVPEGSVILNSPNDGSCFLYALCDANVVYRALSITTLGRESEGSEIIRSSLRDIESDDAVREAVDELGADYLLLLDQFGSSDEESLWSYYPQNWRGIEYVTDRTPGFTVVLAEDDMRLYRIDS